MKNGERNVLLFFFSFFFSSVEIYIKILNILKNLVLEL